MKFFYIILLSFFFQSCDSLVMALYKPNTCDHGRKYKGKLKPEDFDAHKSKRPDM